MTDLKHARRPIRDLVKQLEFRGSMGRPCYLKRNTVHAALIVPMLRNGADGPYSYLRTFQRSTIHEAIALGFVVLGPALVDVPEFAVSTKHWSADPGLMGRTISLAGGAR
ncbi:MAG TPA: hypothetical protein VI172_05775 [Candidatus Dormibacteraeota bacterium]